MNRSRAGICLIVSAFLVLAAVAAGASGGTEAAAPTAAPEAAAPAAEFAGLDRDTYATVAEFERLTGRTIAQYHESPMLAALVAEGKLPPVEERLPEQPLVQLPFSTDKRIGKYGGTLQLNSWTPYMGPTGAEKQHFISAEKEYTQNIFPNLAESFESADGGKTWVITMRRGLKWSDGTPWSSDDVMFWYDDVANNKEFQPQTNYVLLTGGAPLVFEKVDDITWKIVADAPYHLEENVEDLMTLPPLYPKAYLKPVPSRLCGRGRAGRAHHGGRFHRLGRPAGEQDQPLEPERQRRQAGHDAVDADPGGSGQDRDLPPQPLLPRRGHRRQPASLLRHRAEVRWWPTSRPPSCAPWPVRTTCSPPARWTSSRSPSRRSAAARSRSPAGRTRSTTWPPSSSI